MSTRPCRPVTTRRRKHPQAFAEAVVKPTAPDWRSLNLRHAAISVEYAAVAEWDVSTRQTNEGFIRRTIKPALGPMKVRKVRGPILDKLYAELKRCGDLSCTGRPFIEHRNVPVLAVNPRDSRPAWQQVTATLTEAIRSGTLGGASYAGHHSR